MYIVVKIYDGLYICENQKDGSQFILGPLKNAIWFMDKEQAIAAAKLMNYGTADIVLEGVGF